jgi:hypothetical protein
MSGKIRIFNNTCLLINAESGNNFFLIQDTEGGITVLGGSPRKQLIFDEEMLLAAAMTLRLIKMHKHDNIRSPRLLTPFKFTLLKMSQPMKSSGGQNP